MTEPSDPTSTRASLAGRLPFIAAIGLSAFLLFTLELLAGRLVLPVFGGTPAVWTTALCFFAGIVFLGYLYAHLLVTRLGQRLGGVVHLILAGVALVATLFAPTALGGLRFANLPGALNVLVVLALIAGAPAFLLATTSPLLSAWFSERGNDPWWLYAVSNGASLVGLLAYPFLIEPTIPLSGQRTLLVVILVLLAIALGVVVVVDGRRTPHVRARREVAPSAPTRRRQALWLLTAAVPAGLLSATTTYLATDHMSAPLLWIGPLGIYLGSFVVAFSARGRRVLPIAERLVPVAATLMWVPYLARVSWPVIVIVPLMLASYAVLAVALHGRLALDRPDEGQLTRFYLVLSAGGLVATAFVALVAPLVFNDVYEYPILLVAGLAALALLPGPAQRPIAEGRSASLRDAGRRLLPYVIVSALLVAVVATDSVASALFVGLILLVGAEVVALGRSPRVLAAASLVAIFALMLLLSPRDLVRVRTFFGVTQVRSERAGLARSEIHGTTLHGFQFRDARRSEPTAYFVRSGPLGDVVRDLRRGLPSGARIGVVGLGVGTLAAYERPSDSMTFFEVDQAIVDLAHDRRYFTYLADAPNAPSILMGDGRLSLAKEPANSFDLLVLDAFSSDAVPAHLLTREAMRTYLRVLRPGGVIVFQLTNRHFNLVPAVAATARSIGLAARTRSYVPSSGDRVALAAQPSSWVAIGLPQDLAPLASQDWSEPPSGPVLTDDFSDIIRLLRLP